MPTHYFAHQSHHKSFIYSKNRINQLGLVVDWRLDYYAIQLSVGVVSNDEKIFDQVKSQCINSNKTTSQIVSQWETPNTVIVAHQTHSASSAASIADTNLRHIDHVIANNRALMRALGPSHVTEAWLWHGVRARGCQLRTSWPRGRPLSWQEQAAWTLCVWHVHACRCRLSQQLGAPRPASSAHPHAASQSSDLDNGLLLP